MRQPDQRQLAHDLRRHHAGRAQGLCPGQSGDHRHALHPVGRHGAGDAGRRHDPDPGRGPGGHRLRPAGAARRAGRAGQLRQLDLHAVRARRPSARRSRRWCSTAWPSWRGAWACPSAPAARSAAPSCPTPRRRTRAARPCCPTVLAGVNFVLHCGRLARGRPGLVLREVRHRRRPARHDAGPAPGLRPDRERPGHGRHARGRPGQPLPRLRPHPGQLRDRLLPLAVADNNSFEQWEAEGAQDTAQRANALWKKWLADYEAPPLDPGDRRGAAGLHPASARSPCPTPSREARAQRYARLPACGSGPARQIWAPCQGGEESRGRPPRPRHRGADGSAAWNGGA